MTKRWPLVRLGEILVERREIPLSEEMLTGRIRIVEKIGFEEGRIRLRSGTETKTAMILIRPGDLVVSGINAAKGAIAIYDEANGQPVAATIHYGAYIPNSERVDVKFLWWMLRSRLFRELLLEYVPGGIKTELKAKRLLPIPIPLPSLAEQRHIVLRIEELAAKIQDARNLRLESAEQPDALLAANAAEAFNCLAQRYKPQSFSALSPHVTSGPRNWAKHYDPRGVRFYRAQDIGTDGLVLEDSKVFILPPPGRQGRGAALIAGDLMLVITGATVGRVALYRPWMEPGFVSQHVAICRLPSETVDPEYALWGLRSPVGQLQLLGQRYGQGKPGLNLTNIRALTLPFPPLSEQRRAVADLKVLQREVNSLKQLQAEIAAELDALLPAVLYRAFKGEL